MIWEWWWWWRQLIRLWHVWFRKCINEGSRQIYCSAHFYSHLSKDCTENASTTMTPFILKVLKPLNSGNFDFLPAACNWFVFVSIFREKMSSVQNFDWLFRAVGGFHGPGWESYSRGVWTMWYVNQCGMWTSVVCEPVVGEPCGMWSSHCEAVAECEQ